MCSSPRHCPLTSSPTLNGAVACERRDKRHYGGAMWLWGHHGGCDVVVGDIMGARGGFGGIVGVRGGCGAIMGGVRPAPNRSWHFLARVGDVCNQHGGYRLPKGAFGG